MSKGDVMKSNCYTRVIKQVERPLMGPTKKVVKKLVRVIVLSSPPYSRRGRSETMRSTFMNGGGCCEVLQNN